MIKKILGALVVLSGAIFGLGIGEAQAAPKEMAVGIGGGYSSYNNGGYAKLFVHYSPINHLRLAPEVGYVIKNQNKTAFEFSLDCQSPFRVGRGVSVYPLVGFTFNQWNFYDDPEVKTKMTRAGLDLGGGLDVYLTSNLKFDFQAKYSLMRNTSGCFIDLGIAYVF